jgi:hypothetical protein
MTIIRRALPLIVLSCVSPLAQADTERRDVANFTEVAVSGDIDVELVQGAEFGVQVEADDTDDITTEVVGDTLRIYKGSSWHWYSFGLISLFMDDDDMKATVTLPKLTRVRTSGAAAVHSESTFVGNDLELGTSGGSSITLDINYDSVDAQSSGGSRMHLSGTVNMGKLRSSGGSRQNAEDLAIKDADLRSSGGSNLNVGVVEVLTARASGGSDIRYEGDPQIRDSRESGGGDITSR